MRYLQPGEQGSFIAPSFRPDKDASYEGLSEDQLRTAERYGRAIQLDRQGEGTSCVVTGVKLKRGAELIFTCTDLAGTLYEGQVLDDGTGAKMVFRTPSP